MISIFFATYLHNESNFLDAIVDYSNCVLFGYKTYCDVKRDNIGNLPTLVITLAYHILPLFIHLTALMTLNNKINITKAIRGGMKLPECIKDTIFPSTSFISSSMDERLAQLGI